MSALAPICDPLDCPWGVKAFTNYFEGGVASAEAQVDPYPFPDPDPDQTPWGVEALSLSVPQYAEVWLI